MHAHEVGFIPLAKKTVRSLFEQLDDAENKRIADRLGQSLPRELITLMFNKINFYSVTTFLEVTMSRYGMVQHDISGDTHYLTAHHSVNKILKLSD